MSTTATGCSQADHPGLKFQKARGTKLHGLFLFIDISPCLIELGHFILREEKLIGFFGGKFGGNPCLPANWGVFSMLV